MRNPICSSCCGPAVLGDVSLEEQHLRIENARLKDELDRVCSLIGKFLGKPISVLAGPVPVSISNSSLELAVGTNAFGGLGSVVTTTLPPVADFAAGLSSPLGTVVTPARNAGTGAIGGGADKSQERFVLLELALTAMDELLKMAQMGEPLWIPGVDGSKETLNYDEYDRSVPCCIGTKPIGFVSEATRATGAVIINSLALVETLMDAVRV